MEKEGESRGAERLHTHTQPTGVPSGSHIEVQVIYVNIKLTSKLLYRLLNLYPNS